MAGIKYGGRSMIVGLFRNFLSQGQTTVYQLYLCFSLEVLKIELKVKLNLRQNRSLAGTAGDDKLAVPPFQDLL